MTGKASYAQKLRDPRWQKLRLEVLSITDFHCEICGDGESTLHVHHKQYLKGKEPWDYSPSQLSALCENCHSILHDGPDDLSEIISSLPLDGPGSRLEIAALIAGYIGSDFVIDGSALRLFSVWSAGKMASVDAQNIFSRILEKKKQGGA